jgi:glycosyltransferase involved in cell wall biosynthesis
MRSFDFSHEQQVARRPHTVAPTLASVRLILVYPIWKPIMPGSDAGLSNIIRDTMKVLRRNGVHCEAWGVKDAEHLMQRLEAQEWQHQRPVSHVVVNPPLGYDFPDMFQKLCYRWTDIEFVQLNHSGLAYISINGNAFKVIRDLINLEMATHNFLVAGNNTRYTSWIGSAFGKEALYLPNLYDTESYVNPIRTRSDFDPVRIGSFGESRPWKNQLIAAEAALALGRRLGVRLELYVNKERWPGSPSAQQADARAQLFAGLPDAKLITVPWDVWAKFRKTVAAVDIMFSPSFDETFCCVCADGIAEGVPSVVTGAMEWCPRTWWAEPWEWSDVVSRGMSLLQDRVAAVHAGRQHLNKYVKDGIGHWIEYLTR